MWKELSQRNAAYITWIITWYLTAFPDVLLALVLDFRDSILYHFISGKGSEIFVMVVMWVVVWGCIVEEEQFYWEYHGILKENLKLCNLRCIRNTPKYVLSRTPH